LVKYYFIILFSKGSIRLARPLKKQINQTDSIWNLGVCCKELYQYYYYVKIITCFNLVKQSKKNSWLFDSIEYLSIRLMKDLLNSSKHLVNKFVTIACASLNICLHHWV